MRYSHSWSIYETYNETFKSRKKYYRPQEFQFYQEKAMRWDLNLSLVEPLVRSSYKAADYLDHLRDKGFEV